MNTFYSLCFLIQTYCVQSITTSTFIDNSLITSSVAYEQNNISYWKISIDATSLTTPQFTELHDHTYSSNVSAVQLINISQTEWDFIKQIEILVCDYYDVRSGEHVLQTRFDPATFSVFINDEDFKIYDVDCNIPSPTISNTSDCYLAKLWNDIVHEEKSEFIQMMFWVDKSCNCIGCNDTKLFCKDIGDESDGFNECSTFDCDMSEYFPGACPEPVIFNVTDLQCGSISGNIYDSEWHTYRYFVNSTIYSSLIFSTCGSVIDTMLRVRQNDYFTIHDWIDDDTCGSNEEFILYPLYDYDSSIINIDIKAFESGGNYNLTILCSDTLPSTTNVPTTNQHPFDWNSYVIKHTNITLNCDDTWIRMLSYDVNDTNTINVYEFAVNASDYFAVFFSTCGSTIDTRLEARDINWNLIAQSDFKIQSDHGDVYNEQLIVNWIDNYDGSIIYVNVGFRETGNYSLNVECQDHSIAKDINCGDTVFANTLDSYGTNYRFINPVRQSLIFDICSVSDVIEVILYDSNWTTPHNQFFKFDDWTANMSDCAHWEEQYEFDAGIYYLRIENPAAFEFKVICDEPYVFPNPRTSDLIGNNCNYIQESPQHEIWAIDECFGFFTPENDTLFLYSLQFTCDAFGDVWQNWYLDTTTCDNGSNISFVYDNTELFSYNCNAMDSCQNVKIKQFGEVGDMEGGGFLIDECYVIVTDSGFESIKNICFDDFIVEMHFIGFDCAKTAGKEYNYKNITYYNESFIDGKLWIFDSCLKYDITTTNIPQTTNVVYTTTNDQSIAQDIVCGDSVFGNTLNSDGSGIIYRFINTMKQSLIFDICSVSDTIGIYVYDSNWTQIWNQVFLYDDDWTQNSTNCAYWEDEYEFASDPGIYYLRIMQPAAFELNVICNEQYVFPNPRTSDLIGNECNYIQRNPQKQIYPIDECFGYTRQNDTISVVYSLQLMCDQGGNIIVNRYNNTLKCDSIAQVIDSYDTSKLYSYNCQAMNSCSNVKIKAINENNDKDISFGVFLIDQCYVENTESGFKSIKNVCFDGFIVEMHFIGFDCAKTVGKEYNYKNITYYNESVYDGYYWILDPCPTSNTPQTTNVVTTNIATPKSSQSTTENPVVTDISISYSNHPIIFIVCVLCALLYE